MPRDGIPALDLPPLCTVAQVDSLAGVRRGKYLVSGDRVIGVVRNGQARAYPTIVLDWHEVVNDTLGGCPILARRRRTMAMKEYHADRDVVPSTRSSSPAGTRGSIGPRASTGSSITPT